MSLAANGLFTYPNQYSAPDGSMQAADNVFIDRQGVVETARALEQSMAGSFPLNTYAVTLVNNCAVMASSTSSGLAPVDPGAGTGQALYISDNSNVGGPAIMNGQYYLLGTGQIANQTAFCADAKLDCFAASQNIYISTKGGVVRTNGSNDGVLTPPGPYTNFGAGMPKPIASEFTYTSAASGILANLFCYRYRTVYVRVDDHGTFIVGPPSEAVIVYSLTGGPWNVTVRQALPGKWMRPGDIIQVYRSTATPFTGTTPGTSIPLDELQLATEYVIQLSDLTAATPNFVSIPDNTTDSTLGAYLYTNQNTGTGAVSAQYPPPKCNSMALFKNIALYANTRQPPTATFRLVNPASGTVVPTSMQVSNGTTTYTATSATLGVQYIQASPGNGQIDFVTGQPAAVAMAFACVISNNNSDIQVYYVGLAESGAVAGAVQNLPFISGPSGFVNANYTLQLQTLGVGDRENGTWTFTTTGGNLVNGIIPPPPLVAISDLGPNRVYFSVPNQPESVPLLNYIEVGSRSAPVLAITPLRNSIFVWRADGLYRLTPSTLPNGQINMNLELFDETVKLTQFNSVRKAGNTLFAACSRGILAVNEAGATTVPLSANISDVILNACVNVGTFPLATAAACDAEQKYFFMPVTGVSPTAYVYNYANNLWTTRTFNTFGKQYVNGLASGTYGTTTPTSGFPLFSDRLWVAVADNNSRPVWDMVPINGTLFYESLPTVTYVVIDGNNPGVKKRFTEASFILQGSNLQNLTISMSTETNTTGESLTLSSVASPPTMLQQPYVVRIVIPQSIQYCSQLVMTLTAPSTGDYFKLSGVSLAVDTTTLRTTR